MHDQCYYNGEPVNDALLGRLRVLCIRQFEDHADPTLNTVREGVETLCDGNRYDPEQNWLLGLVWDGVPRIDRLLTDYGGVEDTPLMRAAGRKLIIGKVWRALYPGCLHDWALVLEGPQGCGKTSFARILAGSPDKIIDAPIMHEKSQVQQEMLRGRTVQEIAEMSDMKRADTNAIKAYMSRTHDRARGAYAHSPVDQPRRVIYIGTTNDAQYLPDDDNRRFIPAKIVRAMNLEALLRDRDQLHAEAMAAAWTGEDAVVPQHLWAAAAKEQKKRRIADDWEDVIGEALRNEIKRNAIHQAAVARSAKNNNGVHAHELPSRRVQEVDHKGRRVWFVTSAAILTEILKIEPAQQHGFSGKRASKVMGRLGWVADQVKIDGHPRRGFIFDITAKGIAAGGWDQYRDALDEDGDDDEDGATAEAAPTASMRSVESEDGDSESHDETARGVARAGDGGEAMDDDDEDDDEDDEDGAWNIERWRRRRRRWRWRWWRQG
jgi:predicted P-loop ATPase